MQEKGLHPGLEMRLHSLASRINKLKQRMERADPLTRAKSLGEIRQLEQRCSALEDQLSSLNQEGAGFRQNLKAEYEKVADDLAASIQDFIIRADSDR